MRFRERWKCCAIHFCIVTTAAVMLAFVAKALGHPAHWRRMLFFLPSHFLAVGVH